MMAQSRIESGYYDKAVGSVPPHVQCAEDVELVFNNAAVSLLDPLVCYAMLACCLSCSHVFQPACSPRNMRALDLHLVFRPTIPQDLRCTRSPSSCLRSGASWYAYAHVLPPLGESRVGKAPVCILSTSTSARSQFGSARL
jgi:hypothetical protein